MGQRSCERCAGVRNDARSSSVCALIGQLLLSSHNRDELKPDRFDVFFNVFLLQRLGKGY